MTAVSPLANTPAGLDLPEYAELIDRRPPARAKPLSNWTDERPRRAASPLSWGLSAAAQIGLLALATAGLIRPAPPPPMNPDETTVELVAAPPTQQPTPANAPPQPQSNPQPRPVLQQVPRLAPVREAALTAEMTLPAMPARAAPPHPPSNREAILRFEERLRQAVQGAVVYPPSARMMKQHGRVKVGFSYQDGRAGAIRLITSSGFDRLDAAALAAVQSAPFPDPPSELGHRPMDCEIWVEFNLNAI